MFFGKFKKKKKKKKKRDGCLGADMKTDGQKEQLANVEYICALSK